MKVKRPSLPSLITKADRLTSEFIRQKYADASGFVACFTCDKVLHWKDSHCAHFIGRSAKLTRWLEENLHPACPSCNVFRKEFHMRRYTLKMIEHHGKQFVTELEAMERQVVAPSKVRELAAEAIEYYGSRLKEMT